MQLARPLLLVLMLLGPSGQAKLRAETASTPIPVGTELLSNGNFALAAKDPTWPDDWKRKPWVTWQTEKSFHYLQFVANEPGKTFELSRDIPVANEHGVKELEVVVRYRTKNLKTGANTGNDARIKFTFFDAVKIKFAPAPAPIIFSDHADDWTVATSRLKVPAYAVNLAISVGLFQVQFGTLDLAEVSVKNVREVGVDAPTTVDAATTPGVSPTPDANVPVPIRRDGGHTIIGYGQPSIWFIRPYVDVVGHDFDEGMVHLVSEAKDQGVSIAVGVANSLDEINQQDEANMTYVFSYKNINYPLPANARRLVFLNTWLTPSVQWPAARAGKKDVVLIGSRTLNNDGDGLATDKARWTQIQKDDPTLTLKVLDSTGYYLPMSVWRLALLKIILGEQAK